MTYNEQVGLRIKSARRAINMSQDELAVVTGYTSKAAISKIETGVNALPHEKIKDFAKVLYVTSEYIMGIEKEEDKLSSIADTLNESNMKRLLAYAKKLYELQQMEE